MKIRNFLENSIRVIFGILILTIIVINVRYLRLSSAPAAVFYFAMLASTLVVAYLYHKKKFVNQSKFFLFFLVIILIGTIIRVYYIETLDFNLMSDFELAYNTANGIISGSVSQAKYLSYNGYFYVYSYIVSLLFRIFGPSIKIVLCFNMICELATTYFIYKLINIKTSKETSILTCSMFYMLPCVIATNFLVSTEAPFLLLFIGTLYMFYMIKDKRDLNVKNAILFILFGILMSCTNYIRPVMTVFLIALVIYYVISIKKIRELLILVLIFISYSTMNNLFNVFVEKGLNMETRSGALGWSIYFGSNFDYCGSWSSEDAEFVFKFLEDPSKGDVDLAKLAFERLEEYGPKKSALLFGCKYKNLWRDVNGTYGFVEYVAKPSSASSLQSMNYSLTQVSRGMFIILLILTIITLVIEIKSGIDTWLFVELFGVGYILSNLLVCLNGRYNLPLFPIVIIVSSLAIDKLLDNSKKKRTKNK